MSTALGGRGINLLNSATSAKRIEARASEEVTIFVDCRFEGQRQVTHCTSGADLKIRQPAEI